MPALERKCLRPESCGRSSRESNVLSIRSSFFGCASRALTLGVSLWRIHHHARDHRERSRAGGIQRFIDRGLAHIQVRPRVIWRVGEALHLRVVESMELRELGLIRLATNEA